MSTGSFPTRPLILGGVTIPSEFGLEGHSDADVLAHAITDAILGAAALGDIGMHFPDTDPRWKGADSLQFLKHALRSRDARRIRTRQRRFDRHPRTPQAEGLPRRHPRDAGRRRWASPLDRVSVKFKTAEKVGPVGEGKSAEAQAVVTLRGE